MSAVTERAAVVEKGPRFWREGDAVMFQFVIDGGNIIGPRPAVKADSEKHREAFDVFLHDDLAARQAEDAADTAALDAARDALAAGTLETITHDEMLASVEGEVSGQPEGDAPRRKARTTVKA